MLRDFFYEQLSRTTQRTFHRRAAVFYETDAPDPFQAAVHYERAGEAQRAAELVAREAWAIASAGHARQLYGLLETLYAQPVAFLPRAGMLIARGDIAWLLGHTDAAQPAYYQALVCLEGAGATPQIRVLRARACRGIGRALELTQPTEAQRWLERGIYELSGADRLEEAELCTKLGGVQIRLGNMSTAQELLDRAEALMPPGPSALRSNLLHTQGTLASMQGRITQGIACTREAIAVCEQLHDTIRIGKLRSNLGLDLLTIGDLAEAQTNLKQALVDAEHTGDRLLRVMALLNLGFASMRTGNLHQAEQVLREGILLAQEQHSQIHEINGRQTLTDLLIRSGRLAAAATELDQIRHLIQSLNADSLLPELERLHAALALAQNQPALAHAAAQRSVALAREQGQDLELGMGLRLVGLAHVAQGQLAAALDSYAAAVALLDPTDPYEAARVRIAWSSAIANSDPTQSATLLTVAQAELTRQGAALP
jgi:tetratricopeptide (TPR) repeat protein